MRNLATITVNGVTANPIFSSGSFENIGKAFTKAKDSTNNLLGELNKLNSKINTASSVTDVSSSIQKTSNVKKREEKKLSSLSLAYDKIEKFVSNVGAVDKKVSEKVIKLKKDFYSKYSYLKPECEKGKWEKFKDGAKKLWNGICEIGKAIGEFVIDVAKWCKKHWKAIVTVIVVVIAIAVLVVLSVLSCGGILAAIIAGACLGAIGGALFGGISGGLQSMANGGSFWEGAEEGAFEGAISGAVAGAIMGGIGFAGTAFGAACTSCKVFTALKWTARICGGLSLSMAGFDLLSLADLIIDPSNNGIYDLNIKLHSNRIYNAFQFTAGALAVFSGFAYSKIRQHQGSLTCFVAGTMVLTETGLVAIENIRAGDKVISTNHETMETTEKTVVETYIRKDEKLIHLIINKEEIIATETHPFYVKNKGFINAGNLKVGDELLDVNGNSLYVDKITVELTEKPTTVYNFQVEDFHTYYVGENQILVHNSNCKLIDNGDGTFDAELSYKKNWTDEQKFEANKKCKALSEANTFKTPVERKVSPSTEYKKVFGKDSVKPGQDVDHIQDLQLNGVDDVIKNGSPLDSSVNRSLGSQIAYLLKNIDYGTIIKNFTIVERK